MHSKLKSLILSCLFLSACSTMTKVESTQNLSAEQAQKAWADVLAKYVDSDGYIDFYVLEKNILNLQNYVGYIQAHGPKSQPEEFNTPEKKLAYYINSYNALSMYNVIDSHQTKSNSGFAKVKFFFLKKFEIDGEKMSLLSYENDIIRKVGEPRIHFALNCMSVGCPRLPATPFDSKNLEKQLQDGAIEFFNNPKQMYIDDAKQTVYLSEILKFYSEDFASSRSGLIEYVNKYAKKKAPHNYKVEFIPYDWTIIHQQYKK